MEELKTCPFCGGEAVVTFEECGVCSVECTSCHALVDGIDEWNTRAERTCRYLPDEHRNLWDKDDIEWECEEAECFDGSDCSCSECGYTMMGGDDGWFDYVDTEGPNGFIESCVPVPRFKICPNCGAEVARLVPLWRKVEE